MTKKFHNPYEDLSEKNLAVLTVRVSRADYNLIKCMRPSTGTISGVVGTLWFKLCEELRLRGITDVSKQERFEEFVANVELTLLPEPTQEESQE